MNVSLPEAQVEEQCRKAGVSISAIETLPAGGTHVVCRTSDGAETMRVQFKKSMIEGRVRRYAFMAQPRQDRR
ncbi:MAG: hypothetical protein ACREBO_05790 [Novosphingobium sp.]